MSRVAGLAGILLLFSSQQFAQQTESGVICREDISQGHREELADKLRKITGWLDLNFDQGGVLSLGGSEPAGGSRTARELLTRAMSGPNVIVLEDASEQADVAFSQVMRAKRKQEIPDSSPVFVVKIDFADFDHVIGDRRALQAFNIGWALLHEFEHILNDSADANHLEETGECEARVNQMRRECNLPERTHYFYTFLPFSDPASMTRLVRLAFDQRVAARKQRYWLIWDARLVGGLNEPNQIAALR